MDNCIVLACLVAYFLVACARRYDDLRFALVLYSRSSHDRLIGIIRLSLISSSLTMLAMLYSIFSPDIDLFTRSLACASCASSLYIRSGRLYNSIEDIYEAIGNVATILFMLTDSYQALAVSCSLVYISTISAGTSKMQSPMWTIKADGFLKFCSLPSISRGWVRKLTCLAAQSRVYRSFCSIVTMATPYFQIATGAGALLCGINGSIPGIILFGCAHILFSIMLFVIADLSWITSYYVILVLLASTGWIESNGLAGLTWTNAIGLISYFSMCSLCMFTDSNNAFMKKLRFLCFGLSRFKMFTERHAHNILTHHFTFSNQLPSEGSNWNLNMVWNAFNINGSRSSSQNFCSRNGQALMYPIGDYFYASWKGSIVSGNVEKQFRRISIMPNLESIRLYQHSWNSDMQAYVTRFVAYASKEDSFCPQFIERLYELKR